MPMRIPSARIAAALPATCLVAIVTVVANAAAPIQSESKSASTSRSCLTSEARALLQRIESQFGSVKVVSTCRPGAKIAGTGRPSRHASGNAVDFTAGSRKDAILRWLVANHRSGGTMTYPGLDHIHVDIGRHFVSLAGSARYAQKDRALKSSRMTLGAGPRETFGN